jgi:hypothetical protein
MNFEENHESDQHDLTKSRIAVVLLGFVIYGAYFLILRGRVEP